MKIIKFLFFFFFSISVYSQECFTLEKLVKSNWINLEQGVDYFSLVNINGILQKYDSVVIKLKGISDDKQGSLEINFNEISSEFLNILFPILKQNIPDSKEGFLRINLSEMLRPSIVTGSVFLRGDYKTPFSLKEDSISLVNIQGIKSVRYKSKEYAKKVFLNEGNTDWSQVLDFNPLPNSFSVVLIDSTWSEESLSKLEESILKKLSFVSSVSFPTSLFKKNEQFFYFEYKRIL